MAALCLWETQALACMQPYRLITELFAGKIRKAPNKHALLGTEEEIFWLNAPYVIRKKAKENVWPWMGTSALYVAAKPEKQKRVRAALFIRNRHCR